MIFLLFFLLVMNPKGLVLSNAANNSVGKHIHNYSTFDQSLSYRLANTLRFGDYTPSFDMEGVESDQIQLNSLDKIDSLSLKAPFKGQVRKIKESFKVPNMAILPMQWDRIYAQPSNGDDVPKDANCIIKNFPALCKELWLNAFNILNSQLAAWSVDASGATSNDLNNFYTALLRTLTLGEYMYSAGSLLHVSGYRVLSGSLSFCVSGEYHNYDWWYDQVVENFFALPLTISLYDENGSGLGGFVGLAGNPQGIGISSFRALLERFRENPACRITLNFDPSETAPSIAGQLAAFYGSCQLFNTATSLLTWQLPTTTNPDLGDDLTALNTTTLNLSRILAYQLVCAHFYTNSSIDFIYSAELYREYICALSKIRNFDNAAASCFTWNGHELRYDYLSGHRLDLLLFRFTATLSTTVQTWTNLGTLGGPYTFTPQVHAQFAAWAAIFGFRKSLRYGDYFVGSRPRPLAPINTDVAVNSGSVSVIDITQRIQAQRFANAVMRSRSKIEEYVKSLFGKAPQPDFHNPFILGRETETIFGDEVQNTGSDQMSQEVSRTSNFANNVGQYTFTFHNDDMHPCIYLQIISFDIRRAYTRSVDRQMLHIDRFDMFNPDFQYIGDQPVYGVELGYADALSSIPEVFAYQSRDMEYKQRFDVASGAFAADNLPGWILTDKDRSRVPTSHLTPDFIRSYNSEFDQFFISLTGYSLATYFHFICITSNNVNARRPMAVDPQILA